MLSNQTDPSSAEKVGGRWREPGEREFFALRIGDRERRPLLLLEPMSCRAIDLSGTMSLPNSASGPEGENLHTGRAGLAFC